MNLQDHPAITRLAEHLHAFWPEHRSFLEKSFAQRTPAELNVSNSLADAILRLAPHEAGGLDGLCADYRFLCEDIVLPEEIHFRRHGRYRLDKFEDANRECYANAPYMARYMNGLLLSDVFWANHASAFAYFVNSYLPRLKPDSRHLEIGPGHGLFLQFAANSPTIGTTEGWDISPTSLAKTEAALSHLGVPTMPQLRLRDLFETERDADEGLFDSVTLSEILEHLEDPSAALAAVREVMAPGAMLFVNVPANSPAPDHIFLFNSLAHATEIVRAAGFAIADQAAFPMSGTTLERAAKHKLAVSCVVVGEKI